MFKNSLTLKLGVAGIVGVVLVVLVVVLMGVKFKNAEQELRADVTAQEQKIESNYDKMYKTIAQTAQVADKYATDFKEIYLGMMQGRYGDGGSKAMWAWLKEHNPQIDAIIYQKVMSVVESTRTSFDREQRKLADMAAQHKKYYVTIPAKWFVDGSPVEITIVSSTKAKKVMETGIDDDIDVFNKK